MPLLAGSDLELPRNPQQPLQAATKQYVDTTFSTMLSQSLVSDLEVADKNRPASAWQTNFLKAILEREFPAYFPRELRMEVAPQPTAKTFTLPIPATNLVSVDWGDGIIDTSVSHTYANTGTFIVSAVTQHTPVASFTFSGKTGKDLLTKVLKCSLDLSGITSFGGGSSTACFSGCIRLKELSGDVFSNGINATSFVYCFFDCRSLTAVPESLFQFNTKATSFECCFDCCSALKTVPGGLFRYNVDASNFSSCFQRNPAFNLIPVDLFRFNVKATNFSQCFRLCPGLASIPSAVFQYNTLATNFSYCFSESTGIASSAPSLWTLFPAATGTGCFKDCTKIANYASIPAGWK